MASLNDASKSSYYYFLLSKFVHMVCLHFISIFSEEVLIFHEQLMRSLEPHLEDKELLEEDLYKIITEKASRLVYCIGSAIFKNDTWLTDFIDKYDLLNHKAVLKLNGERKPKKMFSKDLKNRFVYEIDLVS